MINFQQVIDSLEVAAITEKANKLETRIIELENGLSFWENLIKTLDVIIWPIALIASLYLFREQIRGLMDRFKSLKVSQSGIEATIDSKIDLLAMTTGMAESDVLFINEGSNSTNESAGIKSKSGGGFIPKDDATGNENGSTNKTPIKSHAESPYQELLELKGVINQKLIKIADKSGLNISTTSNFSLTSILAENGKISPDLAHKLKNLIELYNIGLNSSTTVTHGQVSKIKRIYNNLSF